MNNYTEKGLLYGAKLALNYFNWEISKGQVVCKDCGRHTGIFNPIDNDSDWVALEDELQKKWYVEFRWYEPTNVWFVRRTSFWPEMEHKSKKVLALMLCELLADED